MKGRLVIFALGLSEPGTMGGNSKIALEMARGLADATEVHFVLPRHKLPTLENTVGTSPAFSVHALENYPKDDKFHPFASVRHYLPRVRALFRELSIGPDDFVFGISDFHVDVLPLYPLQREFGFRWLPSVFLFVPGLVENLGKGYGFPAFKYVVYWCYQRILFAMMKRRATGFVITNEMDKRQFSRRFEGRLFAYYGGVNVEQIPLTPIPKTRDVVFCSRLHPQKGISTFLDIWRLVLKTCPKARFTVIGNGDPAYEAELKAKAARLGIADSIDWLGYVNNEEKYMVYASARVHVHPTVFDNNGMVAAEALCSGLPVVMYDLPALRHVYTTGCVKVPFGDQKTFAAEVCALLSDDAHRTGVAPTPEQVEALREQWNWPNRARRFAGWLKELETGHVS